MRTTLDLPEDLFRRTKARAALEGLKLKDLIARFIEQGLAPGDPCRDAGAAAARQASRCV